MPAKMSEEVTSRMRTCLYVLSAFFAEGAEVAAAALGLTQPHLQEGDEAPGFAGVINALGRKLRAAMDRMVSADLKLYAALAWETSLRALRDQKIDLLALQIVAMRRMVMGQYVEPDLDGLGLQPVETRDTMTVVRRVGVIDERFAEEGETVDRMLGEPRFENPFDVRQYVIQMKPVATEVLGLVEEINEAKREVDRARVAKNDSMEEYDLVFLPSVRVFEDLCRYVGKRKLADKVRLTVARARRNQEESPPDGDSPPGDAPTDVPEQGGEPPPAGGEQASEEAVQA